MIDKVATAQAWLNITIGELESNIRSNGNIDSNVLVSSLEGTVKAANGDPHLIELTYQFYGKFLDMGVGKGRKQGSATAIALMGSQAWYAKEINYQVKRLAELMRDKFGDETIAVIKNGLPGRLQMQF